MTTMRARIGKLTTGDLIGEPPVRRHVDEREARQVAEAAGRPNGTSRRSPRSSTSAGSAYLIHPQPQFSATEQAKTDAFLAELRTPCETEMDGTVIERESLIPDEYLKSLARLGVFGMKIPRSTAGSASARWASTRR